MWVNDINSKCEHEKRRLVAGKKWAWKNKNKSNSMEQNVVRRCSLLRKSRYLLLRLKEPTISAKQFQFEDYYISLWYILISPSNLRTCLPRDLFLSRFPRKTFVHFSSHTRIRVCLCRPPWNNHPNQSRWGITTDNEYPHYTLFSIIPATYSLLGAKYFPQGLVLQNNICV